MYVMYMIVSSQGADQGISRHPEAARGLMYTCYNYYITWLYYVYIYIYIYIVLFIDLCTHTCTHMYAIVSSQGVDQGVSRCPEAKGGASCILVITTI